MRKVLVLLLVIAAAWMGPGVSAGDRPTVIPLPTGFQPEGIATRGHTFFVGSIPTGAIYRGDLRTGEGDVFIPGREGRAAIGLSLERHMLFVAGGPTGQGYVYDARSGDELAAFQLTTAETFVNDVVATKTAAYFTDSINQQIYKVPISKRGEFGTPETLPLTGDIVYEEGFNANGIDATPTGNTLVLVQSNTGLLFTVSPRSGETRNIDLGGELVTSGDGILLERGHRLWVVRNTLNLLTLVRLRPDLNSGEVVGEFTHESFDVPTTVAPAGDRLALVNARFGIESPETAEFWVTQIPRPR
jgi:sugar lactone lactonase YvrE